MEIRNPFVPQKRGEYELAEKLRRLRSLRGLTQKQVAQIAGIDESTVRNYELARRMPGPEHINGLAKAYGVVPEAIVAFDDRADQNELLVMAVEFARYYGFRFSYGENYAAMEPTTDFFIEGMKRWAQAYDHMIQDEVGQRDSYELWKDLFCGRFEESEYPSIYPEYDPSDQSSSQRWIIEHFSEALKDMRRIRNLTQGQLAEQSGISKFTLRSYEQGRRLPREAHKHALCDALEIKPCALDVHYFGSPNQAMQYLFLFAQAANMVPVFGEGSCAILRTQGNSIEWALVNLADIVDDLGCNPSAAEQDEFRLWLATYDVYGSENERAAKEAGHFWTDYFTELLPKA